MPQLQEVAVRHFWWALELLQMRRRKRISFAFSSPCFASCCGYYYSVTTIGVRPCTIFVTVIMVTMLPVVLLLNLLFVTLPVLQVLSFFFLLLHSWIFSSTTFLIIAPPISWPSISVTLTRCAISLVAGCGLTLKCISIHGHLAFFQPAFFFQARYKSLITAHTNPGHMH